MRSLRTPLYTAAIVLIATTALAGSEDPWRLDKATNRLVHVPSSVAFPAEIDGLTRGEPTVFDDSGRDVAVPYNPADPGTPIIMTVYVTLGVAGSAKAYFDGSALAITRFNKGAKLESAEEIVMMASPKMIIEGLHGVFRFTRTDGTPVQSDLWVFKPGETAVKFRITYPAAIADAVPAGMRGLLGIVVDWQLAQ